VDLEKDIKKKLFLLGKIKRARFYYLYGKNRILDLYLDNNRMIFGYKVKGYSTAIKNTIARGIFQSFNSNYNKNIPFLKSIFNGYNVLFKENREKLIYYLKYKGFDIDEDFYYNFKKESKLKLKNEDFKLFQYRVFFDKQIKQDKTLIIPILPVVGDLDFGILLYSDDLKMFFKNDSDSISILKLTCLSQALSQLKYEKDYKEKYDDFNTGNFKREYCYITIDIDKDKYDELFYSALDDGLLLNPYYKGASILPALYSKGDKKKIENILQRF